MSESSGQRVNSYPDPTRPLGGTEVLYIEQNGAGKSALVQDIWAGAAASGTYATNISATGTSYATCSTTLAPGANVVQSAGTSDYAVALPTAGIGAGGVCEVKNDTDLSIYVFPAGTVAIEALSAGASDEIGPGGRVKFQMDTSSRWLT